MGKQRYSGHYRGGTRQSGFAAFVLGAAATTFYLIFSSGAGVANAPVEYAAESSPALPGGSPQRVLPDGWDAEPPIDATAGANPGAAAPSVARASAPARSVSRVYYSGCKEARAAGVTPIHAGQPGYGEHMDGDGDGIACERYYP